MDIGDRVAVDPPRRQFRRMFRGVTGTIVGKQGRKYIVQLDQTVGFGTQAWFSPARFLRPIK